MAERTVPETSRRDGQSTWALIRRGFTVYTRRHVVKIVAALLLAGIASATATGYPLAAKRIFALVVEGGDASALFIVLGALLVVLLVRGFASLGQEALMSWVGNRIVADIQQEAYAHLMQADLAYFHNKGTGNLISHLINDMTRLRTVFSDVFAAIGRDILMLVFLVAMMFYQDWLLACMIFVVFPLVGLPIERLGRLMRRISARAQEEIADFTSRLEDSFQGIRHVKAYGQERQETERASRIIDNMFRLNYRATLVRAANDPILEMMAGVAIILLIVYAAAQVNAGARQPQDYVAFMVAFGIAYEPVRRLARLWANLQQGLAACERVFAVLDTEPEIRDRPGAPPIRVERGDVRLEDVSFAYHRNAPALRGVTLDIPAGRTVALVGPSGAGKTTVLNLIPRFYDCDAGRVLIDGQDIRDVSMASLRASIGLVSQDTTLFDDTVRANIAYGRPGATDEEIAEAAAKAAAHQFIEALPQGYKTQVGGLGVKLSGGQRQRIAIARAMLKNAPILLLDEATSSLDTESERTVQTALRTLMRGRTTLVIAHRLSTIVNADIIYVIEDGRVREFGRHNELLAAGGPYARLYTMQTADVADAPSQGPETGAAGQRTAGTR